MKHADVIARNNPSQSHWELNEVLCILERNPPKRILEIGVHVGGSLYLWRELFKPELLIGINTTDEIVDKESLKFILGDSKDSKVYSIVKELANTPLDLLFIDGGHLYHEVKQDWLTYSPLVRSGGIAVFHDVVVKGNDTVEVYKLWEELRQNHKTVTIWDGTPTGTGEGVVFL